MLGAVYLWFIERRATARFARAKTALAERRQSAGGVDGSLILVQWIETAPEFQGSLTLDQRISRAAAMDQAWRMVCAPHTIPAVEPNADLDEAERAFQDRVELQNRRHYGPFGQMSDLLQAMKAAKGDARYELAKRTVAMSRAACADWHEIYPGEPLPQHEGFARCAIELERAGQLSETIALCERAATEGWCGDDWQKRIDRCRKRMTKR